MNAFEQYFKEYCVKTNLPADSPFTTACKKIMEDAWDAGKGLVEKDNEYVQWSLYAKKECDAELWYDRMDYCNE